MKLSEKIEHAFNHYCAIGRQAMEKWRADAKALESKLEQSIKSREEDGRDYRAVIEARYKDIKDLQNAYEQQCGMHAEIAAEVAELKGRNERQKSIIETLREEVAGLQNNLRNADLRANLAAHQAKNAQEGAEVLKRKVDEIDKERIAAESRANFNRKTAEQLGKQNASLVEALSAARYELAAKSAEAEAVDNVVGRAIDFIGFHSNGVALGRLLEYGVDSKEIRRIDNIPINGITFQP